MERLINLAPTLYAYPAWVSGLAHAANSIMFQRTVTVFGPRFSIDCRPAGLSFSRSSVRQLPGQKAEASFVEPHEP